MGLLKRELTTPEQDALARYRFINDFSNLVVVWLKTKSRKGEYIVEIPEGGELPDPDNANDWGDSIICNVLWLQRLDAKYAAATEGEKLIKSTIDIENIVYHEFEYPENVHVLGDTNAFVRNHLTKLRDERTTMDRYVHHSDHVSRLLISEAIADLNTRYERITTGTGDDMLGARLDEGVVLIEIPRGSKPMAQAARQLLPKSPVGTVVLQRNEEDPESRPESYLRKLPPINEKSVVVITDPMLATGGSMTNVIREIAEYQPKAIKVVAQIAAPEGVRKLQAAYPEVEIWTGELDSHLDGRNYIRPGLGDAGDRYHGTQ